MEEQILQDRLLDRSYAVISCREEPAPQQESGNVNLPTNYLRGVCTSSLRSSTGSSMAVATMAVAGMSVTSVVPLMVPFMPMPGVVPLMVPFMPMPGVSVAGVSVAGVMAVGSCDCELTQAQSKGKGDSN